MCLGRPLTLEILDDRHDRAATLITSQLPFDQWHAYIGDHTIADAILDRLVHNAYKINLKGDSMRKAKSPSSRSQPHSWPAIRETLARLGVKYPAGLREIRTAQRCA
jgi:hypothetical protein